MFDFYKEYNNFVKNNPFIYTDNNILMTEYIEYFQRKYDCIHMFRMAFWIDPQSFVNDFRQNIVQSNFSVIGQQIAYTTLFQFSTNEHASIAYGEFENKLAASLGLYVSNATVIPDLISKFEKYKIEDKKKFVGFGPTLQ